MTLNLPSGTGRPFALALVFGALSFTLYALLYAFEDTLVDFGHRGGWYFLVPVLIAFVLSYVHGSFTAHFWDFLGIKTKK